MNPIKFAMVGSGWRAESFWRIARELPRQFQLSGVLVRSAEKAQALAARWGCPTFESVSALTQAKPDFVLLSVPWLIRAYKSGDVPMTAQAHLLFGLLYALGVAVMARPI